MGDGCATRCTDKLPRLFPDLTYENRLDPNVAKAGGLQSQGVKGEVVVGYRKSLTTQDLESSGFPEG